MKFHYLDFFRDLLTEAMSWAELLKYTQTYMKGGGGAGRIQRAGNVHVRSNPVSMEEGKEAWNFNYKSNPSTTGKRWHGFVRFLKGEVENKDNAQELQCIVNCDCPDYKYVWAYPNKKKGAGFTGRPYNDNNGRPWLTSSLPRGGRADRRTNPHQIPGMCKHLIALAGYLETEIKRQDVPPTKPLVSKRTIQPSKSTPNIPSDDGSLPSQDLYESIPARSLYEKIVDYGKLHPEFVVPYYDEVDEIKEDGVPVKGSLIAPPNVHEYTIAIPGARLLYSHDERNNEFEILNIGVQEQSRNQGKASQLLDKLFSIVKERGGYVTTGALTGSGEDFLRKLHDRFGKKYGVRIVDVSRYD